MGLGRLQKYLWAQVHGGGAADEVPAATRWLPFFANEELPEAWAKGAASSPSCQRDTSSLQAKRFPS